MWLTVRIESKKTGKTAELELLSFLACPENLAGSVLKNPYNTYLLNKRLFYNLVPKI
jgi:hypothetical protein